MKGIAPGTRCGKLVVQHFVAPGPQKHPWEAVYACLCDCGKPCQRVVTSLHDRSSCGCAKKRRQPKKTIVFRGRLVSFSEMSAETGIKSATLRLRMKKGMTPEEASAPVTRPRTTDVFGEELTARELASVVGVAPATINGRKRSGWHGNRLLQPNRKRYATDSDLRTALVAALGVTRGIAADAAKIVGMSAGAARVAIKRLGIKDAMRDRRIFYEGRPISLKELAARAGVSETTIHSRLKKMTPEAAVVLGRLAPAQDTRMPKDLTGREFGMLRVRGRAGGSGPARWTCVCSCGSPEVVKVGRDLYSGNTGSCGCMKGRRDRNDRTCPTLVESPA